MKSTNRGGVNLVPQASLALGLLSEMLRVLEMAELFLLAEIFVTVILVIICNCFWLSQGAEIHFWVPSTKGETEVAT